MPAFPTFLVLFQGKNVREHAVLEGGCLLVEVLDGESNALVFERREVEGRKVEPLFQDGVCVVAFEEEIVVKRV